MISPTCGSWIGARNCRVRTRISGAAPAPQYGQCRYDCRNFAEGAASVGFDVTAYSRRGSRIGGRCFARLRFGNYRESSGGWWMFRPVGSALGGGGPRGTGPQARHVTLPAEGPAQVSDTAASVLSPSGPIGSSKAPSWRAVLAPYARPDLGRSMLNIITSVV